MVTVHDAVKTKIEGLTYVPIVTHMDDRGYLREILRASDPHFTQFGQVYMVGDMARGTIRGFHKHEKLWDWFFISHGSAKFNFYDDRPDSPTYKEKVTLVAGSLRPLLITVPPGVHHGWMSLEDDTQLISIASEVYNRENPDEERVPPDSFGFTWEIEAK